MGARVYRSTYQYIPAYLQVTPSTKVLVATVRATVSEVAAALPYTVVKHMN